MDLRRGLAPGRLTLGDAKCRQKEYDIISEKGRGGTFIVYDASYTTSQGVPVGVIIRECYPFSLNLTREPDGTLTAPAEEEKIFADYKENAEESFRLHATLYGTKMQNDVTIPDEIYHANNTVYLVSRTLRGTTPEYDRQRTLEDIIAIVKGVAEAVLKIHEQGYLYLDIKPSNLLLVDGHSDFVQLFDFGSLIPGDAQKRTELQDLMISCSRGFSPIEQMRGNISRLGRYTDVYSLGALLFYLLWGTTPTVLDASGDRTRNFRGGIFEGRHYRDSVYGLLDRVLSRTLPPWHLDRYDGMENVIEDLRELEKDCGEKELFVSSSYVTEPELVVGRSEELNAIDRWYRRRNSKCLVVHGVGGIGKSTVVKKFISDRRDEIDNAIYMWCKESIDDTFLDDSQLYVNTVSRGYDESDDEYFDRKLNALKETVNNTKTLMVIDDFTGDAGRNFIRILGADLKAILITRQEDEDPRFDHLTIGELKTGDLATVISSQGKGNLFDDEKITWSGGVRLAHVFDMAYNNTLLIELIGKQLANTSMTIDDMEGLLEKKGPARINAGKTSGKTSSGKKQKGKVDLIKDDDIYHDTVGKLIRMIFSVDNMEPHRRALLRVLSVYLTSPVSGEDIGRIMPQITGDDLSYFSSHGWISLQGKNPGASAHPIPGSRSDHSQISSMNIAMHPLIRECLLSDRWGSTTMDQFDSSGSDIIKGYDSADINGFALLWYDAAMRKQITGKSRTSFEVGVNTIRHLPVHMEKDILRISKDLLRNAKPQDEEIFMDLIESMNDIYVRRHDHKKARACLDKAKRFAEKTGSHFAWARYYDHLGWLQDDIAGGPDELTPEAEDLLDTLELSLKHIKKSDHPKAPYYHARYLIDKVNVKMRAGAMTPSKARKMIAKIDELTEGSDDGELQFYILMIKARFCADMEGDVEGAEKIFEQAEELGRKSLKSDIEFIEQFLIPAANIMFDYGRPLQAECCIEAALRLCDENITLAAFRREKEDLTDILEEIKASEQAGG